MNKIVLSALAALTLGSAVANASGTKLYQDANGQVFTKAAEDRTEITVPTPVFSHADKLKFSGLFYLGYVYNDRDATLASGAVNTTRDSSAFEIRRGYFQAKAYFLEDPKSYFRITYDLHPDDTGDEKVRAKYAYLYLNNILPATGVEIGLAHRPWHDYEEHNSWYFRDISKVLIEAKNGADLSNSADFGVMTKTRTKYFEADIGLFNGEGYHSAQATTDMSLEWRATGHLLGTSGKDKQDTVTYWDASFFGQFNKNHKVDVNESGTIEDQDLVFYGLHTVYNQPEFLLSAQYVKSENTSDVVNGVSNQAGTGYSFNGEYRLGAEKQYRILGRYDSWTPEAAAGATEYEQKSYIAGLAWDQNTNLQWVANVIVSDNDAGSSREKENGTQYMLTAQVEF